MLVYRHDNYASLWYWCGSPDAAAIVKEVHARFMWDVVLWTRRKTKATRVPMDVAAAVLLTLPARALAFGDVGVTEVVGE